MNNFIQPNRLQWLMFSVLVGLIPALIWYLWFYQWIIVIQLLLSISTALIAESSILWIRRRPLLPTITDGSAVLTAVLLSFSLPPAIPWWITIESTIFAIIIVKQIYGGLGYNIFNPAMAGYIFALISFPQWMSQGWIMNSQNISQPFSTIFYPSFINFEGMSAATPLDHFKTQFHLQLLQNPQAIIFDNEFDRFQGLAIAYLIGGLFLLWRKLIAWQISCGFLLSLFIYTFIEWSLNANIHLSPWSQLIYPSTTLTAFFIATDPVTAATSSYGRWIYAILIGILAATIRNHSHYADGLAFAILLANITVPTIDRYTQLKKI